jgi:hypothetical protein
MGSFDPAIALPGLMHDQASHPLREPMAILADVRFSLTPASLKTQRRKGWTAIKPQEKFFGS